MWPTLATIESDLYSSLQGRSRRWQATALVTLTGLGRMQLLTTPRVSPPIEWEIFMSPTIAIASSGRLPWPRRLSRHWRAEAARADWRAVAPTASVALRRSIFHMASSSMPSVFGLQSTPTTLSASSQWQTKQSQRLQAVWAGLWQAAPRALVVQQPSTDQLT